MTNTADQSDFLRKSYYYDLPQELIAERPISGRDNSRLLVYDQKKDAITHSHFYELYRFLPSSAMLVLNQSKVFPCRLMGKRLTGGKVELMLLSLNPQANGLYHAMIRSSRRKKVADKFIFGSLIAELKKSLEDGTFLVSFSLEHEQLLEVLNSCAEIPIPPYIRDGKSDSRDRADYQTVYARDLGSVAAPTAGLHFTDQVFDRLDKKGVKKAFVTLHVGAGTFAPVKTEHILEHQMHGEDFSIDSQTITKLNVHHGAIYAVGTTSLRVLESCWQKNNKRFELPSPNPPFQTNIFLHPGVEVNSIAGLITNFHLPESTLLMLVSALIGRQKALEIYRIAIEAKYRFFSYGDAMLILRK